MSCRTCFNGQAKYIQCDVCRLVDKDYNQKKCKYCKLCDAWICEKDMKVGLSVVGIKAAARRVLAFGLDKFK